MPDNDLMGLADNTLAPCHSYAKTTLQLGAGENLQIKPPANKTARTNVVGGLIQIRYKVKRLTLGITTDS